MDYTYIKNASVDDTIAARVTTDDGLVIRFLYDDNGEVCELIINGDDYAATSDMFSSFYVVIKGEFKSISSVISEVNIVYQDILEQHNQEIEAADREEKEYTDTANFHFNHGKI